MLLASRTRCFCNFVTFYIAYLVILLWFRARIFPLRLLAHLSRRLTGELIGIRHLPVRHPHFSKIFSETTWPIKAKFYMNHLWEGGTNRYINNSGHMTKMATMPIYGKNPSKTFFSGTDGSISMKLGMKH